ncbi:hypothetical protein ZTR_07092 [Talaromyces verruculosus]|nr:hypothetical protein ZTR_07092 [Talaromyces verruculosus]
MQSSTHELQQLRASSLDHNQSLLPKSEGWSAIPWKLEILSWIGNLCSFIAIIVVLNVLKGRPLPDLQYGITPNAILTLLATFGQALLIAPVSSALGQMKWLQALEKRPMDNFETLDKASRGPLGSAFLIADRKSGPVTSFGAFVTIVALGVSTFIQRSLKYTQFMNGTGYAPMGNTVQESGVDAEQAPWRDVGVTTVLGTHVRRWVFRSTCQDLSSSLNMTKVYMAPYGDDWFTYNTDYYTLSNGFGLTGAQPGSLENQDFYPIYNAMMNVTTSWSATSLDTVSSVWGSIAFPKNGSTLMSVFVVGPSPGTIAIQPDMNYTRSMNGSLFAPPVAYECLLQFCVRNMRADIMNRTIHETVLSTWTNETLPESDPAYQYADLTLHPPGSSTPPFVVKSLAVEGVRGWLRSLLEGNSTIIPDTIAPDNWRLDQTFSPSSLTRQFIALNLRQISHQRLPVRGKAFTATSHAVITWEWLILPFFELVGSLVFLIIVMIQTRQGGLSVPWTNSTLAYFFHGLDERPVRGVVYQSEEKMAEELQVKFERGGDGGHLVIVK